MNVTKFDLWKPSADNPRKWEYMGQRTAIWMIPNCCKRRNAACRTPFFAQRFTRT